MSRSAEQRADDFDLDLFRLISRAEDHSGYDIGQKAKWRQIARILRQARPAVRSMMSDKDRAET